LFDSFIDEKQKEFGFSKHRLLQSKLVLSDEYQRLYNELYKIKWVGAIPQYMIVRAKSIA